MKEKTKPKEPKPVAPPPAPMISSANEPIGVSAETAPSSPLPAPDVAPPNPKVVASMLVPAASSSCVELPGDHPIPVIASGALVAFAAVTFAMRGNVDE